jgi:dihydropteroate synthase
MILAATSRKRNNNMEGKSASVPLYPPMVWNRFRLDWGARTYVMGIVNMTPDSFSGDGLARDNNPDWKQSAVDIAMRQVAEGADIIDIGGASSRPGAPDIPLDVEMMRVVPAIQAISAVLPPGVPISVDTTSVDVALAAIEAGAQMINDISGLVAEPDLARVAADAGVPLIVMANRRNVTRYEVVSDVIRYLAASIDRALAAGVQRDKIIIDPGFGFGNTPEENIALLRQLDKLKGLRCPILLGVSRKSTLGYLLDGAGVEDRLEASLAAAVVGVMHGAEIVRVHDVMPTVHAMRVADAIARFQFPLQ